MLSDLKWAGPNINFSQLPATTESPKLFNLDTSIYTDLYWYGSVLDPLIPSALTVNLYKYIVC